MWAIQNSQANVFAENFGGKSHSCQWDTFSRDNLQYMQQHFVHKEIALVLQLSIFAMSENTWVICRLSLLLVNCQAGHIM